MVWRAISNWIIAGCISGAAVLNVSADSVPQVDLRQNVATASHSSDLIPSEPSEARVHSEAVAPSPAPAEEILSAHGGPAKEPKEVVGEQSPEGATQAPSVEEYKIQPEDILQVTVYEEPDLTTKIRVATSGEINFPLLGRLQVSGLSVMELQEKLTELLSADYLVNPQVQVFIESYHARDVFVTGAVTKPGSYPLPAGKITTVMEAITMAGGFSKEAAVNGTRIIRTANGKEDTIYVKANDIIKKGDKSKDVEVRPNDVVFVPESFF